MVIDKIIQLKEIENRIFTIRSVQVMIDKDLAEMYGLSTKRLNEQVKRNITRFPHSFMFQLNISEKVELVANCDRFKNLKHASSLPYAFTEQGVAMLSAVLHSETAIKVSIQIMSAFVEMRKTLIISESLIHRINKIELKQYENDEKFDLIFNALERKSIQPERGVFFDGQIYDAYTFFADKIRGASKSICLIDNYIDDTVLTLFAKREKGVTLTIYTRQISKSLILDITKYNEQYGPVEIKEFSKSHDRFLIIDDELYHIGASLKDLGKKWFAFSRIDSFVEHLRERLNEI